MARFRHFLNRAFIKVFGSRVGWVRGTWYVCDCDFAVWSQLSNPQRSRYNVSDPPGSSGRINLDLQYCLSKFDVFR